jgi:geranylgeranyl pyrophosphate synthase
MHQGGSQPELAAHPGQAQAGADPRDVIYGPVLRELDHVVLNIASVPADRNSGSPEVEERLAHVMSAPGKRVRPAITLLASRLWGRPADERAIKMATAVELLHIASLMHDDTVDSADTRRGRATASSLWGGNVAVLLGDYVFASSAMFVCETNNIRLIKRFAETITELSRGELNETFDSWRATVTRDEYFRRIYDKTASLFSTAAESGAVLGEADEERTALLRKYGHDLGMAYQVHDDVLDYEESSDQLGKPAGRDLAAGVLTLPAIIALETGPARQPVLDFIGAAPQDRSALLPGVLGQMRGAGAVSEARRIASDFTASARAALASLPPSPERDSLLALTDFLRQRRS